jgi:hypothetical protein
MAIEVNLSRYPPAARSMWPPNLLRMPESIFSAKV